MNVFLTTLEMAVVALALMVLLADLWVAPEHKRRLGYAASFSLFLIFCASFQLDASKPLYAFGNAYVMDDLAIFFKRFFLLAGSLVLLLGAEFASRVRAGLAEMYALMLFALTGMMFAASANSFAMLFVSLELITVTFYVLTAFQREERSSLEAGVKYLILGALSSAFMVFGIALVFGTSGTLSFSELAALVHGPQSLLSQRVFQLGMLLILAGLGFKMAAVPFQIWTPDVYQGAPAPVTAFLAVGSKAAGFALVTRVLVGVMPELTISWQKLLLVLSALTILYGNLCAIPQRNLKRLLGYSSIAHAGYLLMGIAALGQPGTTAILYYLSGYLFTVIAAFAVICLVIRQADAEDISSLAGLNERSPFLAAVMTLAMASLAGIPPLAGFFGKFLLLKAVIGHGAQNPHFYCLAGVAVIGVVISLWYYFGVVRVMYWSTPKGDCSRIEISFPSRLCLYACIAGMLYFGLLPNLPLLLAEQGAAALK